MNLENYKLLSQNLEPSKLLSTDLEPYKLLSTILEVSDYVEDVQTDAIKCD